MTYLMTNLEKNIESLYKSIGMPEPGVSIDELAERLGVELIYGSLSFSADGIICIDRSLSNKKAREVFAHELCHSLYHVGNQLNMYELFREYQEYKAENFAMHFCIPTFMLLKIKLPKYKNIAAGYIAEIFDVTNEFALKRLEHYHSQLMGAYLQTSSYLIN